MKAVKSDKLKALLQSKSSKNELRTALANLSSGGKASEKDTRIHVNKNTYKISPMPQSSEN